MAIKIKVCGITNLADAEAALQCGADMLGFNFYPPSPRCLKPQKAKEIIELLPTDSFNVALFVNQSKEKVTETLSASIASSGEKGFSGVQFHGEEDAGYCRGWGVKVIKAFRLKERTALDQLGSFPADLYLLDSYSAGFGGSGTSFPWGWLDGIDTSKLILSGGLGVDNVAAAVGRVRPFGVDVCSGVEARPGIKDHGKLKAFIAAAKGA
ncbi:MAG: phosphoribosylanthranilate isomerase [Candidatus Binatia bacterium]